MPDFPDWDEPEFAASSKEEREYAWDLVKTGARFLIFTTLLYTLIIWGFSNLLFKNDILSGDLSWRHAGIFSFGIIVLRTWNRTFFK